MTTFAIRTMTNMVPSDERVLPRKKYKDTMRALNVNPDMIVGVNFSVKTTYRNGTPHKLLTLYLKEQHED